MPQNPLDYDNRTSQGIFRTMRINWQELASKSVKSPIHKFVFNRFIGIASLWNSCHLNGHNDTSPWFIKMDAWLMGDNHGTAFFSHCRSSSLLFYRSGQCRALWGSARRAVKQGSCKKTSKQWSLWCCIQWQRKIGMIETTLPMLTQSSWGDGSGWSSFSRWKANFLCFVCEAPPLPLPEQTNFTSVRQGFKSPATEFGC